MHEKFIHGTQKFVYLLVYLTGGSSFEVISPIYCRAFFFMYLNLGLHISNVYNDDNPKRWIGNALC